MPLKCQFLSKNTLHKNFGKNTFIKHLFVNKYSMTKNCKFVYMKFCWKLCEIINNDIKPLLLNWHKWSIILYIISGGFFYCFYMALGIYGYKKN